MIGISCLNFPVTFYFYFDEILKYGTHGTQYKPVLYRPCRNDPSSPTTPRSGTYSWDHPIPRDSVTDPRCAHHRYLGVRCGHGSWSKRVLVLRSINNSVRDGSTLPLCRKRGVVTESSRRHVGRQGVQVVSRISPPPLSSFLLRLTQTQEVDFSESSET